jgi:hypothetical protein
MPPTGNTDKFGFSELFHRVGSKHDDFSITFQIKSFQKLILLTGEECWADRFITDIHFVRALCSAKHPATVKVHQTKKNTRKRGKKLRARGREKNQKGFVIFRALFWSLKGNCNFFSTQNQNNFCVSWEAGFLFFFFCLQEKN